MASVTTPLEDHVAAIGVSLAQNRVDIKLGALGQHEWGAPRRILFEPLDGTLGPAPTVQGKILVEDGKWGKAFRSIQLNVRAHLVAETNTHMRFLWQNMVVASWASLKGNSREGSFDLNPTDNAIAAHLYSGARYMTQDFTWTFNLFDNLIDLPPYSQDVTDYGFGAMVPMEDFTTTVTFLEYDEPNP